MLKIGMYWGGGIIDYIYDLPDVKTTGDDRRLTWVVGKFESYRVLGADRANEFLYTEIGFRIETVIYEPNTPSVAVGSIVDVYRLGGSLRTANGVVHGAHFYPERYDYTPGHTYILALRSAPAGFFSGAGRWDVTHGVVEQSSVVDEDKVQHGKSEIVGKPLAEAIQYIKDAHSPEGRVRRGDTGCSQVSSFAEGSGISGDDFMELHRVSCYDDCPLYSLRVYGDGRLVWHGDERVASRGDATAASDAGQARALLWNALRSGFGGMCEDYVQGGRGTRRQWEVSLKVGGQLKAVRVEEPSDEPLWLDALFEPVTVLPVVKGWIGGRAMAAGTPWR